MTLKCESQISSPSPGKLVGVKPPYSIGSRFGTLKVSKLVMDKQKLVSWSSVWALKKCSCWTLVNRSAPLDSSTLLPRSTLGVSRGQEVMAHAGTRNHLGRRVPLIWSGFQSAHEKLTKPAFSAISEPEMDDIWARSRLNGGNTGTVPRVLGNRSSDSGHVEGESWFCSWWLHSRIATLKTNERACKHGERQNNLHTAGCQFWFWNLWLWSFFVTPSWQCDADLCSIMRTTLEKSITQYFLIKAAVALSKSFKWKWIDWIHGEQ